MLNTLSIIIVNYKAPKLVLDCLQTVYAQEKSNYATEIIVVDNFSEDGIEVMLAKQYPEVKLIQMGYNAGFARANNAGIKISKGEVVLLLNSDTLIEQNAINKCVQQFTDSTYVACGVQLLNVDRSPQISGNFAMRGGINCLLPLPYIGKFLKKIASLINVQKPNVPDSEGIVEVDWVNGAFLMAKKTAIEKAGLLDEDFFLYAEESEWCSRLKKQGKLCIYGDCKVVHLQGETSTEVFGSEGKGYFNLFDKRGLQIMVSNFLRIRKQFGLGWYFFNLFFYIITLPVFLVGILFNRITGKTGYTYKQWTGFRKNVGILVGLCPKMLSGKPFFYKML